MFVLAILKLSRNAIELSIVPNDIQNNVNEWMLALMKVYFSLLYMSSDADECPKMLLNVD